MTPVEILRAARARIDTPEKWTKHALGLFDDGSEIEDEKNCARPDVKCLCAEGAFCAATKNERSSESERAFERLGLAARARGHRYLYDFNDAGSTTHADVMALFDEAIAAEESGVTLAEQEGAAS